MYKTANVDVDIEITADDVIDILESDYWDFTNREQMELRKIMKEILFDDCDSLITSEDIIKFLKRNEQISNEVKEALNKNEMVQ